MSLSPEKIAERYMLRTEVRSICASDGFRNRSASLQDFTPETLEAFGEAFILQTRTRNRVAFFKGLGNRLRQLWDLFKKAPQLWQKIKT